MITCSFEQRDRDVHVSSSWRLPADLRDSCLLGTVTNVGQTPSSDRPIGLVTLLCGILALLAVISSLIGLLVMGGPGRQMVTTARGATVIIYGKGIYAADSWLLGTGNRGQDVAILLVEVPFLLLTLWWYRRGGTVAAVALTGGAGLLHLLLRLDDLCHRPESTVFGCTSLPRAWLASRS
jgi:hypothetical protein